MSRRIRNQNFHITNKFEKTMLLGCVKKWDLICHIIESMATHCLSGVKTSHIQVVTRYRTCLLSDIIRNNLDRYQKVFHGGREKTKMKS